MAGTSPFASLASCGGDTAAAADAPSSSPGPPSALKLSVSGRLSRSFSKLGLSRMSSSSLSRKTLLDEGKSRCEENLRKNRRNEQPMQAERDRERQRDNKPLSVTSLQRLEQALFSIHFALG